MKTLTKIKWVKGYDFMDDSPRYSFEGRDPQSTYAPIRIVIYTQRQRKFSHDSTSTKNYYYVYIRHDPSETADELGRFETLKQAKIEAEKIFNEYCELFPNDTAF